MGGLVYFQRLNEGFSFFEEWAENLHGAGCFDVGVECKKFISWQVATYRNYIIIIIVNFLLMILHDADLGFTENYGLWFPRLGLQLSVHSPWLSC